VQGQSGVKSVGLTATVGVKTVKIRKKPVVVEAEPVDERTELETREGTLVAERGDFVITGVEGEQYPIDAEIMKDTYEPADEDAQELWQERFGGEDDD